VGPAGQLHMVGGASDSFDEDGWWIEKAIQLDKDTDKNTARYYRVITIFLLYQSQDSKFDVFLKIVIHVLMSYG
jgi:hypothetical protein